MHEPDTPSLVDLLHLCCWGLWKPLLQGGGHSHQSNCTAFPSIPLALHLHCIIITHTWPPSGNPPHLLRPISSPAKQHSLHLLTVWTRGYTLFICLITHLLDLCGCLPPVDSTKGEIRTTNSSVYSTSLSSELLHLPFSCLIKKLLLYSSSYAMSSSVWRLIAVTWTILDRFCEIHLKTFNT